MELEEKNMKHSRFFYLLATLFVAACGGGGSGPDSGTKELSGQFLDSAVSGLRYETSGGSSGITNASGTFNYRAGERVKFYLGDILLGEAKGAATVTPIDLVPNASDASDPTVQNIARLLQSMDEDGNPGNGITISPAVRDAAAGLTIDFSAGDFDSQATSLLQKVFEGVGTAPPMLVAASDAEQHLQGTLIGRWAGTYRGTYTGDDTGTWEFTVTTDNRITVSVQPADETIGGMMSFPTFYSNGTFSGDGLEGRIASDGSVSGTWGPPFRGTGTFSGRRVDSGGGGNGGGSGGGGTGGTAYGGLSMAGVDTSSKLGTRFEPSSGTGVAGFGYMITWADVDMANQITRFLLAAFSDTGQLTMLGFGGGWDNSSWSYSIDCFSTICDAATLNSVSIDRSRREVRFNGLVVPNDTEETGNLATGPVTLNGTLRYVEQQQ